MLSMITRKLTYILLAVSIITAIVIWIVNKQNTTSTESINAADTFSQTVVASGLENPTAMSFAPDGRIFVSEKKGALRVIKNGQLLSTPFLTISVNQTSERGLLGIAFDPAFNSNRYIYIYYTKSSSPIKNRVSRFRASSTNPDIVESGSETILLDNIPSDAGNHNGGALNFGPDGKLYIATGDGGSNRDNSQDLNSLAGKILRLNKDGTIPNDNPFVGQTGRRGEIWAYGLRNPFTFAFRASDGKMHINDVGQSAWEEVNVGTRGANYGWPTCEGNCNVSGMTNPIYQYNRNVGIAITGGAFYEGNVYPNSYQGNYFFGDYGRNWIKRMDNNGNVSDFMSDTSSPVDIKLGPDGLLYFVSITNGSVNKINYTSSTKPGDANGDNRIDGLDYVIWLNNYNRIISGVSNGDFNNNNKVDGLDYVIWLNNYGK